MMRATGLAAALLAAVPASDVAARTSPALTCVPAVPAEYVFYHALAASHPALPGKRGGHASCIPHKGIRT